jgi:hypothetical protein
MPTVLRNNGIEVMIYTRDHLPKHVHCFAGDEEVIISLDPLGIRVSYASNRVARQAFELVKQNKDFLIAEWDRIGPVP